MLPVNCLFDKGITGCGGTELALKNAKNTIVAVPYVSLIENKINQEQHRGKVLGVSGGFLPEEISEYLVNHSVIKIMVTYDSLPRLINTLIQCGINPYEDIFLLVDEWHILFNSYVFRKNAIQGVLDEAPKFKEVTYMTATPIEEKYLFDEFKNLPVVEVVWPNVRKIKVIPQQTNNTQRCIAKTINKVLNNQMFGNLHIFVNSVDFIARVVKRLGLQPEQVKIVCSKNTGTVGSKTNQQKLGADYQIATSSDPVKRINFYTSTCFEGCDIFDTEGRIYIISDGNRRTTQIDIATLLIQICGRIRDTKYKDVTHVFSKTRYSGVISSVEEYEEIVMNDFLRSKTKIEEINGLELEARTMVIGG